MALVRGLFATSIWPVLPAAPVSLRDLRAVTEPTRLGLRMNVVLRPRAASGADCQNGSRFPPRRGAGATISSRIRSGGGGGLGEQTKTLLATGYGLRACCACPIQSSAAGRAQHMPALLFAATLLSSPRRSPTPRSTSWRSGRSADGTAPWRAWIFVLLAAPTAWIEVAQAWGRGCWDLGSWGACSRRSHPRTLPPGLFPRTSRSLRTKARGVVPGSPGVASLPPPDRCLAPAAALGRPGARWAGS
jgi:hypothetical protein